MGIRQGQSASAAFGAKTDFATSTDATSVTSDDFKGDGNPDLVVANFKPNTVSVLLGDGLPFECPKGQIGTPPNCENMRATKAEIGSVKVTGPKKVKKNKKTTYKVKILNSGNAAATGVRLKVTGRGVSFNTSVGKIQGGKTRRVKLKPKKPGKVKVKFKVTSKNAGSKTVKKKIKVKE